MKPNISEDCQMLLVMSMNKITDLLYFLRIKNDPALMDNGFGSDVRQLRLCECVNV